MNNSYLLTTLIGLTWAAAPLIGRVAQVNAMMMAALIALGTFLAAIPMVVNQNYTSSDWRSICLVLFAGVLNGIGLTAFYRLVAGANEGLWEMSKVLPIAFVLVPIGIMVGSRIFYGEYITTDKMIGIVLACGAIWFLNK
jgi:hypothetical protein